MSPDTRPAFASITAGPQAVPYHATSVVQRPPAGTIPDAPGPTSSRTPTAGSSTSARPSPAPAAVATTSATRPRLHPRTAQMVATAETVEWIQVRNDVEALMLEYSLIKQHRPRFNVRLRDDKSYPFLAVTARRRVAPGRW